MTARLFYLQDSRSFVGNDVLWWRKGGNGYTTDLREAETYTEADAQRLHVARNSDIPWPKDYIDDRSRPAVDFQKLKRVEALADTGIEIVKISKQVRERLRCNGCGAFLSASDFWAGACPRCGTDNRP